MKTTILLICFAFFLFSCSTPRSVKIKNEIQHIEGELNDSILSETKGGSFNTSSNPIILVDSFCQKYLQESKDQAKRLLIEEENAIETAKIFSILAKFNLRQGYKKVQESLRVLENGLVQEKETSKGNVRLLEQQMKMIEEQWKMGKQLLYQNEESQVLGLLDYVQKIEKDVKKKVNYNALIPSEQEKIDMTRERESLQEAWEKLDAAMENIKTKLGNAKTIIQNSEISTSEVEEETK